MGRPTKKQRGVFERQTGSGVWCIQYFDRDGRRHRETVGARGEAMARYRQRKDEIRSGKFDPEGVNRPRRIFFAEIADDYIEHLKTNNKSDVNGSETRLRFWKGTFHSRTADSITPDDVEAAKKELIKDRAPATVDRYLVDLRAAYNNAIGKVRSNPFKQEKKIEFYNVDNARVRHLEEEEWIRLVNACEPERLPFLITARYTGIRLNALMQLTWEQVDFRANVITVPARLSKSKRSYQVFMNAVVRETLEQARQETLGSLKAQDTGNVTALPSALLHGKPVFPQWFGKPVQYASDWFRRALRRRAGVKDLHFHDLRHDFGSQLAMKQQSIEAIRRLMGHSEKTGYRIVQRYINLSQEYLKDAVKALEELESKVRSATKTATAVIAKKAENG